MNWLLLYCDLSQPLSHTYMTHMLKSHSVSSNTWTIHSWPCHNSITYILSPTVGHFTFVYCPAASSHHLVFKGYSPPPHTHTAPNTLICKCIHRFTFYIGLRVFHSWSNKYFWTYSMYAVSLIVHKSTFCHPLFCLKLQSLQLNFIMIILVVIIYLIIIYSKFTT